MTDATGLRRSVLFVPGGDPRKIDRARGSGADTIVLDLEDAVPPESKEEARDCVVEALTQGRFGHSELAVRINPPTTAFFEADISAIAPHAKTVMLPKSDRAREIVSVTNRLSENTSLMLLIETPLGVADALRVASATPNTDALCFGHADFSLEMGLADSTVSNPAVHHARGAVAIAAKACAVTPIDCVYIDVRDDEGFGADTRLGLSFGYEGRLCIHPRQAELANEIYTPAPEQIEYAHAVVEGWEAALRTGSGVFTMNGKMIDQPLVSQQKRVLSRARKASPG